MVYVMLANGFEEVEALAPVDMLRRAGVECRTVGVTGKVVTGSHGIPVEADITLDEADAVPEMLVLPGGQPGTDNLNRYMRIHRMMADVERAGGYLAAICAAPGILGYDGYLMNRTATCYPGHEKFFIGGTKSEEHVVRDGKIITADGMGSAVAFGAALVEALTDAPTAEKILKSIQV